MVGKSCSFVDTNVLLYAHDGSETVKQPIARALLERLWAERAGTLSTQVLQEFYTVATCKLTPPISRAEAREVVGLYSAWPVVLLDSTLILAARPCDLERSDREPVCQFGPGRRSAGSLILPVFV